MGKSQLTPQVPPYLILFQQDLKLKKRKKIPQGYADRKPD